MSHVRNQKLNGHISSIVATRGLEVDGRVLGCGNGVDQRSKLSHVNMYLWCATMRHGANIRLMRLFMQAAAAAQELLT